MRFRQLVSLGLALTWAGSCIDATDVELLEIEAFGTLAGVAFVDLNGNGVQDAADQPLENVRVDVVDAATQQVVEELTTATLGAFFVPVLPVGSYGLRVAADVLGDSLTTLPLPGPLHVERDDTAVVALGVSYPSLSIEEVRAAPAGSRVFTSGIALNARPNASDGQVHFQGASAFLRATNVARATGGSIVTAGDSVRLLGRTAVDNGQPVLDEVTATVLIPSATVPIPGEFTTAEAASAGDGSFDAALVNIRQAEITDTATMGGDVHVWVDDGSGPLEIVLRSFLAPDASPFRPDTIVQIARATGLLSAHTDGGTLRWRLLPRTAGDIVLELRESELAITTSFDASFASFGQIVTIQVVVTNAGPVTAHGVEVRDTVPADLAYTSATATRGGYDPGQSLWVLDELLAGAADTLWIETTVSSTSVTPIAAQNRGWVGGLDREVDPTAANNGHAASLTIVNPMASLDAAAMACAEAPRLSSTSSSSRRTTACWTPLATDSNPS